MLDTAGTAGADAAPSGSRRSTPGCPACWPTRSPGRRRRGRAAARRRPGTGTDGVALVAVGSLGRRRAAAARRPRPGAGARRTGRRSPRSPTRSGTRSGTPACGSTTRCAPSPRPSRWPSTDVKAGLGLLDARLVAGDADLAARLRTATLRAAGGSRRRRLLPAAARPAPGARAASSASSPSCSSPTSRRPTAACARGRCCARVAAAQLADEPDRGRRGGLRVPARRPRRAAPPRPAGRPTSWSARSSGRSPRRSGWPTRTRCCAR